MVEWYYYLEKGKAKGPLEQKEVRQAVEKGKLGLLDLIYKEGSDKWTPLFELSEFEPLFKETPKKAFQQAPRRNWVILQKKKAEEGRGFRQVGPFTEFEIRKKIHAGQVSYQDYAWKAGFKKWTKIRELSDFTTTSIPVEIPAIHPDEGVGEVPENSWSEISKSSIFESETGRKPGPPLEADTKDLTRPWEPEIEINIIEDSVPGSGKVEIKRKKQAQVQDNRVTLPELPKLEKTGKITAHDLKEETLAVIVTQETPHRLLIRLTIFGISLCLVSLLFILIASPLEKPWVVALQEKWPSLSGLFTSEKNIEVPESKSEPKLDQKVEAVSKPEPPAKKAELSPEPVQAPNRLTARRTGSETVEVRTDGSSHFRIRASLFGKAGRIYAKQGVFREKSGTPNREGIWLWELKDLPKGDYLLYLTQDKLTRTQNLRFEGSNDRALSLNNAKKWQAPTFNSERRDLAQLAGEFFNMSKNLENAFVKFRKNPKQWSNFYRAWMKDQRALVRSRRFSLPLSKRVLPWQWHMLSVNSQQLAEKAKTYNKAVASKASADSLRGLKDLSKEFAVLRTEALALRLF